MPSFKTAATHLLLDIEGTTSSIRFVTDEMFPFVRRHLLEFVDAKRFDAAALLVFDQIRDEAARLGFEAQSELEPIENLVAAVNFLMDRDAKVTGLKKLQGMIWESGFLSGHLIAHLYPEVPECLLKWKEQGRDLRIYSSGSVAAQKLFFGHTIAGNLLPYFSAHYDTTVGGKKEADSYTKIVEDIGISANSILFVSDVVEDLAAAQSAGLQTVLSVRLENPPQPTHDFPSISSFSEIELQ
ncbi:MAG: acireductone synthase [Pirellulaceae bacterium]|nr:acireductone synthase [Pirellulaceae bacterium]